MPSTDILIAFFLAAIVFAVVPGPAILYTAAQTMARGRRGGLFAALGIHVGGFAHVIAAAAGLSAVFRYVPEAYLAIKVVGALYLIWLGIGILRQGRAQSDLPHVRGRSARRAFAESVVVEVLNPKAALFYIAFLPQFVDPTASAAVWLQLLILGWVVNILFSAADLVTIFLTSAMLKRVRSSGWGQRIVRYVAGSVLIVLGVRLAAAER